MFARHDRSVVEVYCVSLKSDGGSAVEKRLKDTCHNYFDYTHLDNYAAAAAVNELGIQVRWTT